MANERGNHVRKLILAALLTGIIATPVSAHDKNFYAGIEGGVWDISTLTGRDASRNTKISGQFDTGYDVDVIGGYDWGLIRTEGELAYKRANFQTVEGVFYSNGHTDGYAQAFTGTVNVLVDFEIRPGFHLYAGPGIGYGWFKLHPRVQRNFGGTSKLKDENASGLYGQLIAGASFAVTPRIDFGLKARHIQSQHLSYDAGIFGNLRGKFKTNSLLASLVYNFGAARVAPVTVPPVIVPAPEAAPTPPPATQTCADGSVILASDACPPPPPPPPPPAAPERG